MGVGSERRVVGWGAGREGEGHGKVVKWHRNLFQVERFAQSHLCSTASICLANPNFSLLFCSVREDADPSMAPSPLGFQLGFSMKEPQQRLESMRSGYISQDLYQCQSPGCTTGFRLHSPSTDPCLEALLTQQSSALPMSGLEVIVSCFG